jgi:hypothetical protein
MTKSIAIAVVSGLATLVGVEQTAFAQAGSTGGTIGKTDKSASRGESKEPRSRGTGKAWKQAQDIPHLAGTWSGWVLGLSVGTETIEQSGGNITCINERRSVTYGKVTGRRSFSGCWGLDASVSEDIRTITWSNGAAWKR